MTRPPFAIVSVPAPEVANVHPKPSKWSRAGHRRTLRTLRHCRCWRRRRWASVDDRPAVRGRECPGAKTADIEPAAYSVDPAGPGPVTVTVPVEPAANPTEPPPLFTVPPSWIVGACWPPTTTLPAFDQLEPAPVTVTVPSPVAHCRLSQEVGHCPTGLDCQHPCPVLTDGQISG